ncbi:hypothetical protein SAMN05216298_1159 [Glycomyces sambucus]|uniref:Uncharacterized protein n=1 Tax=Glycomyces sambucus TaxID=380244 RepID=A0A1G9DX69_9ACTN|nr:hypothetical protein SAMN05216298_1159 [Glycomyces sambucus]
MTDTGTTPRRIPGQHKSDGGIPPWCFTCSAHYRCPIRFPCGTYRLTESAAKT